MGLQETTYHQNHLFPTLSKIWLVIKRSQQLRISIKIQKNFKYSTNTEVMDTCYPYPLSVCLLIYFKQIS